MLFTDPVFLFLLLPLACLLFYTITPAKGISYGFGALLVISLLFYLPWGFTYFCLLIASITANFVSAYLLLITPDSLVRRRRIYLALGLAYNFVTLAWFKYSGPVLNGLTALSSGKNFSAVDLAIPIGISFYTFQQAVFLIDAFQRDESVVAYLGNLKTRWGMLRAYVHHAFFVAFFPHLVIGPIVYLSEFQPQVENSQFGRLRTRNLEVGITLIAIGLIKKIGIADNLALIVDPIYGKADTHTALTAANAWLGAFGYYAQLYFDFSGYSDMALGLARMLGVRFPINFYSPLKATSIVDFYKRWHITLTRAIARFFYIPISVSGARFATSRGWGKLPTRMAAQWFPLLLNFEAIALWHGARLTFLLFGLIHGTWYVVDSEVRRTKMWKSWKRQSSDGFRAALGRGIFTFIMVLTFALFRSNSLDSFGYLANRMFLGGGSLRLDASNLNLALFACSLVIMWFMPNAMEILQRYRPGIVTYANEVYVLPALRFVWRPNVVWACGTVLMFIGAWYFVGRQPAFLYMGF